MRKIFHNGVSGISFGIDSDSGATKLALAFCGPRDKFDRKKANLIVNRRLDHKGKSRCVFQLDGKDPMTTFKFLTKLIHSSEDRFGFKHRTRARVDLIKTIVSTWKSND